MRLLPAQETEEASRAEALLPEENGRAASERPRCGRSGGNVSRALATLDADLFTYMFRAPTGNEGKVAGSDKKCEEDGLVEFSGKV